MHDLSGVRITAYDGGLEGLPYDAFVDVLGDSEEAEAKRHLAAAIAARWNACVNAMIMIEEGNSGGARRALSEAVFFAWE